MQLTVVGCSPAYTRQPGRASSCYLVEHGPTGILLDFGQGAFSELSAFRPPEALDAVFISHLHADHNVDLVPLRHYLTFELPDVKPPALYGPTDLRQRLRDFQTGATFDAFAGEVLEPGSWGVGGVIIQAARVTHIPDSFAFRLSLADSDGPGVVYSGDCGVADDLLQLVKPGDWLLCESGFGVERPQPEVHLTAQEAGAVARIGGAQQLVLTHLHDRDQNAETLEIASAAFGRAAHMAQPGMRLEIVAPTE
jgi:ribonuclease BN (tRNA processing enzyme)